MEKKKLSIKKFQVAKLNSLESIKGGMHSGQSTCTEPEPMSGLECTWSLPMFCIKPIVGP